MLLPAAAETAHRRVAAARGRAGGLHARRGRLYLLLGREAARNEPSVPRTRLLHRRHHLRLQRPPRNTHRRRRHLHRRGDGGRQRPHLRRHDLTGDAPRGGARTAAPLRTARQDAAHRAADAPQGGQIPPILGDPAKSDARRQSACRPVRRGDPSARLRATFAIPNTKTDKI